MTGMACRTAGCTRGLPGQTHCAANVSALEEIPSRIGTAASRDAVTGLEQGRISRSWQPSATTSRWRPWPNPGVPHVPASPARMGRDWDARAGPLGQAPSDRRRQRPPRPGCLIPCHPVSPVSLQGRAEGCCCYTFTTVPDTQKALSRAGKGLGVRVRPDVSVGVRPDVLVCREPGGLIMAWAGWCRW